MRPDADAPDARPSPPPEPTGGPAGRHARQVRFRGVGPEGQERIRRARVLIAGCGALGTQAAEHLVRAGVGAVRLVDRDLVEWSNLHRQTGYVEADARARQPKALALAEHLAAVDGAVELEPRVEELDHRSAARLAEGCDLILDGTDNLLTRFLLNDLALWRAVPWIYAGVVEGGGMVQPIGPGGAPCLRCTFPELPPPGALATCASHGVLGPAAAAVAGVQAALALRAIVEGPDRVAGRQLRIDAWGGDARAARVRSDPDCPACAGRRFDFLEGRHDAAAVSLCGRQAVQVRPARGTAPGTGGALARVRPRLAALGEVEDRGVFLRAHGEGVTVTVFADGRAIFDGLTDAGRARSLYARFVGE